MAALVEGAWGESGDDLGHAKPPGGPFGQLQPLVSPR
jgi:hypothetical protein